MPFLSGKQAFLQILKQEGVECMFGNPGTTELPLMDGLAREPGIRYVLALQESVAIAMADGYAHASGKLAAVNVHTSPGLGNAMGMLYDARMSGAPMLLTAGQHDQAMNLTEPILWSDLPPVARPVREVVARDHAPGGPAPRGAPRRQDRARASERARLHLAAGGRAQCRARAGSPRVDADRAPDPGRRRGHRGRRRPPRARQAARHRGGRRHHPERRAQGDGGGGRAPGRARLRRMRALHLRLPLHASALRGAVPAAGPAHPQHADGPRPPLLGGR